MSFFVHVSGPTTATASVIGILIGDINFTGFSPVTWFGIESTVGELIQMGVYKIITNIARQVKVGSKYISTSTKTNVDPGSQQCTKLHSFLNS